MEKIDRRVKMTKKMLNDALISLMKTKSIHQITVKEICLLADVNRSTFYKHYDSVYDLYNEILNSVADDFAVLVREANEKGTFYTHRFVEQILNYCLAKKDYFLVILSENSSMILGEALINSVDKIIDDQNLSLFGKYIVQFITAGMSSIVWMWLNEEEGQSAHNLAMIINTMLNHGLKRAFDMSAR